MIYRLFVYLASSIVLLFPYGIVVAQSQIDPEKTDANKTQMLIVETTAKNSYIDALVIDRTAIPEWEKWLRLKTRQQIVRTFCDTILQQRDDETQVEPYFDNDNYRYDPRQSVMMYGLCVTFDERRSGDPKSRQYKEKVFDTAVKYDTIWNFVMSDHRQDEEGVTKDLVTLWWLPDEATLDAEEDARSYPCDPAKDMQLCDFSNRLPKMYQTMMDELVTMRQASVYGYKYYDINETDQSKNELALESALKDFSMKYFVQGEDGKASCNDAGLHYLSSSPSSSVSSTWLPPVQTEWDRKHCIHPKTARLVKDTIRDQWQLLKWLDYLKKEEFFSQSCDKETRLSSIHRCAQSSYEVRPWISDTQSFHNVLLNELMRYNLFINYYLNNLTTNNDLALASVGIVAALNDVRDEVAVLTYEQELASQATQTTMRMLDNIITTYPIHVWLQAYLEDIKWYRKQLAKVYTPMHQLYYLLRNVQSCSSS